MQSAARNSVPLLRQCATPFRMCSRHGRQPWRRRCRTPSPALLSAGKFLSVFFYQEHAKYSSLHSLLSQSTWGPNFRRRQKIERHMRLVAADDALLVKEGLGDRLTHPELLEALEERGMYVHPVHFMRIS